MRLRYHVFYWICLLFCFSACDKLGDSKSKSAGSPDNPPAEGFNVEASDDKAIALADKVMKAMGGRDAWNSTEVISWDFFGIRKLVWDKQSGDVRIDHAEEDLTIIVNINTMEGRVAKNGQEVEHPDSLQKYLEMGRNIWINDSYWLVMPFKMKDTGVALTYLGEDLTQEGDSAYVVALTFENVGQTPQNKYHVFIDKNTHLVTQWAYYAEASQDSPNFVLPWKGYKEYNGILLSGDRGERKLSSIEVMESAPSGTYTKF